ncbi:DUF4407 domain-containing protein [Actinocorallia aurantiaca]|uniref:HTH cro/C1-type domain-containing protein n=1 Tax=Actinocorallia aurantiaca TaxID=46204 RepID=A0ABP6H1A9_9ACTN
MSKSGRAQEPLPATGDPRNAFTEHLKALRGQSGLTFREMAEQSNYSPTSLTAVTRGKKLPSWDVTAAFVRVCGGDEEQARRLWEEAACAAGRPVPAVDSDQDPPDPMTAASVAEYMERLNDLRAWSGLSLRKLDDRSTRHEALPRSTISDNLRRTSLPDTSFMFRYLKACGLTDDQAQPWLTTYDRLAEKENAAAAAAAVTAPSPQPDPRRWAVFLRRLLGFSEVVLDRIPHERARYTRRSALHLIFLISNGAVAFVGISAFAGVFWALFVAIPIVYMDFVTNKAVVVSLNTQVSQRRRYKGAVPHLVLLALAGLIIAEPLMLQLYQVPIENQVTVARTANYNTTIDRLRICNPVAYTTELPSGCASFTLALDNRTTLHRQRLAQLKRAVADQKDKVDDGEKTVANLQQIARLECAGLSLLGGSDIVGEGPRCMQTRRGADRVLALQRNDKERLHQLQTEFTGLTFQIGATIDRAINSRARSIFTDPIGLLERQEAFTAVSRHNTLILTSAIGLRVLIILLPMSVVLLTLLEKNSPYQRLLQEDLDQFLNNFRAQSTQQLHELLTSITDLLQRATDQGPTAQLNTDTLVKHLTEVHKQLTAITESTREHRNDQQ